MIYLLLAKEAYSQYRNISLGIVSFKSLSSGLLEWKIKDSSPIDEAESFIEQLGFLMNDVFNPGVTFEHNEKSKYCKYC